MGASLFSFSLSMVSLSSRRSSFVPTRMIGTCGQWCRTWKRFIRIHQVIITEHVSGVRYSPLDTIWLSHSRSWLGSRGRNKSGTRPEERKTFMLSRFVHQPYRLRIGEGPQSVVILLSGCVPQTKVDRPAIHLLGRWVISFTRDLIVLIYHNIGRVVVEDGWNILSREGIGCVTDQQTSFTYSKYWSTH